MYGRALLLAATALTGLAACTSAPLDTSGIPVKGEWIKDPQGEVMHDPQTSGLVSWRGSLVTVSDGSAETHQRLKLHPIEADSARLSPEAMPIRLSSRVEQSCFADYLADEPDLEALAVDPDNDRVFVLVTEDASRSGDLSKDCLSRFSNTGSTEYPTLLVRVELQDDNTLLMTHVRPIQYQAAHQVGDFPNDGIEGLAFAPDRTLYLSLEKDAAAQARIFSVSIDAGFWDSEGFAPVTDPQLKLPYIDDNGHPINGMDYVPVEGHPGYLVAAARNDNEIWWIDLSGVREALRTKVHFLANTDTSAEKCQAYEVMHNASIEGLAVVGNTLWMVNDPWKKNYMKNVQCEATSAHYEAMAPLLFSMLIDPSWTPAD